MKEPEVEKESQHIEDQVVVREENRQQQDKKRRKKWNRRMGTIWTEMERAEVNQSQALHPRRRRPSRKQRERKRQEEEARQRQTLVEILCSELREQRSRQRW